MPHGGYHGVVKMGGKTVQQGSSSDGQGGQQGGGAYNPQGYDTEIDTGSSNIQNNQTAKQLEEQIKNQMSGGAGVDFDPDFVNTVDPREAYIAAQANAGILSNLLRKEQEEKLRNDIIAQATISPVDIEQGFGNTGVLNKSNLLGYEGGLFGLNTGPKIGGTTYPIAAETVNPITGEKIITRKAREGLSTPDYNQFIQELSAANPELYRETFPFASGQIAKPFFARMAEGIMGIPGVSEIGQMGGDILGAMTNPVSITFQLPESDDGEVNLQNFDITAPKLDLGQYSGIPEKYKGFFESEFAKPVAGGMAITYVTLPDGSKVKFGDTGSAAQFRKYLESIGVIKPESTEDYPEGYGAFLLNPPAPVRPGSLTQPGFPDKDGDGVDDRYQPGPGLPRPGIENVGFGIGSPKIPGDKMNIPAALNYANIAPQFTGSPYTNQGVSPAFLENLRRFYG